MASQFPLSVHEPDGPPRGGFPFDGVEQLREAAAGSGQTTGIVRYPEAGHGFHCDQRGSFEAKSAEDAWARTLAWFTST